MDSRPDLDTPVRPAVTESVHGRMYLAPPAPARTSVTAPAASLSERVDLAEALVPDEVATWMRAHRGVIVGVAVVGLLTELLPDAPWILIIPALAGIAAHRLGSRVPFTFATGLIGPRADSPGRSMS